MKIAIVCADDFLTVNFSRSLVRHLATLPRDVRVYTISALERGFTPELEALGVTHIELPLDRFINPRADLLYARRLFGICRTERFDTVLNFTTKPVVYGAVVERLAGVEDVTCAIRGLGVPFTRRGNLANHAIRWVLLGLYGLAFSVSRRVWFTNRDDAAFFTRRRLLNSAKVLLTANAIDVEFFRRDAVAESAVTTARAELGLTRGDVVVLMVARLLWSKGVREFAEAATHVGRVHPEAKFVLVGGTDERSPDAVPLEYIEKHEREGKLRWLGFRKDVRPFYRLASVAVLPSYLREGGYPRALLEPMAFAIPVVAADTPHSNGAVEHGRTGILVPPHDSPALAAAIERLLDDAPLREALGARARAKVENEFDDRVQARTFISALLSTLDRRATAGELATS